MATEEFETYILVHTIHSSEYSLNNVKNIGLDPIVVQHPFYKSTDLPKGRFKIQNVDCVRKYEDLREIKIPWRDYHDASGENYTYYCYGIIELGDGLFALLQRNKREITQEPEPFVKPPELSSCIIL